MCSGTREKQLWPTYNQKLTLNQTNVFRKIDVTRVHENGGMLQMTVYSLMINFEYILKKLTCAQSLDHESVQKPDDCSLPESHFLIWKNWKAMMCPSKIHEFWFLRDDDWPPGSWSGKRKAFVWRNMTPSHGMQYVDRNLFFGRLPLC